MEQVEIIGTHQTTGEVKSLGMFSADEAEIKLEWFNQQSPHVWLYEIVEPPTAA